MANVSQPEKVSRDEQTAPNFENWRTPEKILSCKTHCLSGESAGCRYNDRAGPIWDFSFLIKTVTHLPLLPFDSCEVSGGGFPEAAIQPKELCSNDCHADKALIRCAKKFSC